MRGFHFGSMLLPGIRGLCLGRQSRDLITMDPWLGKNCNVKLYESLQYKKCTYIVYLSFALRHFKKAKITIITIFTIFFFKYHETLAYYFFLYCLFASSQINCDEKLIYHLIYLGILWPKSVSKGFLRTCNLIYNDRIILSKSVKE